MWHAEVSSLVLRRYEHPTDHDNYVPFNGVVFVKTLSTGVAFIEGALRHDNKPLERSDWRELALLLRDTYGIHTITADRHGRRVTFDTRRVQAASLKEPN